MDGLFLENGPFRVKKDLSLEINEGGWQNYATNVYGKGEKNWLYLSLAVAYVYSLQWINLSELVSVSQTQVVICII